MHSRFEAPPEVQLHPEYAIQCVISIELHSSITSRSECIVHHSPRIPNNTIDVFLQCLGKTVNSVSDAANSDGTTSATCIHISLLLGFCFMRNNGSWAPRRVFQKDVWIYRVNLPEIVPSFHSLKEWSDWNRRCKPRHNFPVDKCQCCIGEMTVSAGLHWKRRENGSFIAEHISEWNWITTYVYAKCKVFMLILSNALISRQITF